MTKLAAKYERRKMCSDTDPMACCNWKPNLRAGQGRETCLDPWRILTFRSIMVVASMAIFWNAVLAQGTWAEVQSIPKTRGHFSFQQCWAAGLML